MLWGRCWADEGTPAYWPWIQILRPIAADRRVARTALTRGSGLLSNLVPEFGATTGTREEVVALDSDSARFQLFDAVSGFLGMLARTRPMVLIFEDLHWADQPSVLLLEFLTRGISDQNLLVLSTYRESEARHDPEVAAGIARLMRQARHMPLRGLERKDADRLVELLHRRQPPSAVLDAIYRATEGNPFYIDELIRLLDVEGALERDPPGPLPIPAGVRETIRRRLEPLPDEALDVLRAAAVIGTQFQLPLVAALTGLTTDRLVEIFSRAADLGTIAATPVIMGSYSFAHALVRETLYEEIPHAERLRLHLELAGKLEEVYAQDLTPHLTELAHHYAASLPLGPAEKAVGYARRAGEAAMGLFAFEEAVRRFEEAVRALEGAAGADDLLRTELTLLLGEAHVMAGRRVAARGHLLRAAQAARARGHFGVLARAAVALGTRPWDEARSRDQMLLDMLDEARRGHGEADGLGVRVIAQHAVELHRIHAYEQAREVAAHGVEVARMVGDAGSLAFALSARFRILDGPDDLDERLAIADEMVRISETAGDRPMAAEAHTWRLSCRLERADAVGVDREIAECAAAAHDSRQPARLWGLGIARTMHLLLEGRVDEGEAAARENLELSKQVEGARAFEVIGAQTFAMLWHRGILDKLEEPILLRAREFPREAFWPAVLGLVYAESGRKAEARAELQRAAESGFSFPKNSVWLQTVQYLARVCAFVQDEKHARSLYDLLLPYPERFTIIGMVCAPVGPVAYDLGLLAATMGRHDEACRHLDGALEISTRMRAAPFVALTALAHARTMLARAGPMDAATAVESARRSVAIADELQMTSVSRQAARVLERAEASTRSAPATAAAAPVNVGAIGVFRRDGDFWTVGFPGRELRLREVKGFQYIRALLARPGEETHALALVSEVEGIGGSGALPARVADAGLAVESEVGDPLLDPAAKATLRKRIQELREQIDEAESWEDLERASRAREELQAIEDELGKSVGLGGRDRHSPNPAERARLNVTRMIRRAMDRIVADAPDMGAHLERSIRTGAYCAYDPHPAESVCWQL